MNIEPGTSRPLTGTVRIVVADDHAVIRFGVRAMLAQQSDFEVIGDADNGFDAAERAYQLKPDVLVLDLEMPGLNGLEVLRDVMQRSPQVKTIILSSTMSSERSVEALLLGARGIVDKYSAATELCSAVRAVTGGDYWVSGTRTWNLVKAVQDLVLAQNYIQERETYGLTPLELKILGCVAQRLTNKEISKQFHISEDMVKRHLSHMFGKTGVSSRLELAMFALRHGLVVTADT